jgi:hypothetical protein
LFWGIGQATSCICIEFQTIKWNACHQCFLITVWWHTNGFLVLGMPSVYQSSGSFSGTLPPGYLYSLAGTPLSQAFYIPCVWT